MMEVIESISRVIKSFIDDEPTPPLHVGEVMSLWTYLVALREAVVIEQTCVNMTTSPELVHILKEGIHLCTEQTEKLEKFLINEGVPLPAVSSTKPETSANAVPCGAKLTEDEIANTLALKTATAVTACATAQSQTIRNDVGLLWVRFQMEQMTFGGNMKALMRKNGWLKIPPYYIAPGVPSP